MREPETLKELIEWLEWNYERLEDDHDVICSFTDGDGFHELLNDLRASFAMCKANSNDVLAKVRAIIDSLYGKRVDDMYSQALDDIKKKLSEHFI